MELLNTPRCLDLEQCGHLSHVGSARVYCGLAWIQTPSSSPFEVTTALKGRGSPGSPYSIE